MVRTSFRHQGMEGEAKEDSPDANASTTSRTRTEVDAGEWIPRAEDTAIEPCSARGQMQAPLLQMLAMQAHAQLQGMLNRPHAQQICILTCL